jgi:hypothetical protein
VLSSIVLKKLDLQLYLEGIIFDRELVIIMQGIHRAGQCQELLQIDNFPLSDHLKKNQFSIYAWFPVPSRLLLCKLVQVMLSFHSYAFKQQCTLSFNFIVHFHTDRLLLIFKNEDRLREALKFANACGALTVKERGAIPALPTREAVNSAIIQLVG